jgi:hypothetical protein
MQAFELDQRNTLGAFYYPSLPVIKTVAVQMVLPAVFNLRKTACLPPGKHLFPVYSFFFAFNGSAFFHDCPPGFLKTIMTCFVPPEKMQLPERLQINNISVMPDLIRHPEKPTS